MRTADIHAYRTASSQDQTATGFWVFTSHTTINIPLSSDSIQDLPMSSYQHFGSGLELSALFLPQVIRQRNWGFVLVCFFKINFWFLEVPPTLFEYLIFICMELFCFCIRIHESSGKHTAPSQALGPAFLLKKHRQVKPTAVPEDSPPIVHRLDTRNQVSPHLIPSHVLFVIWSKEPHSPQTAAPWQTPY